MSHVGVELKILSWIGIAVFFTFLIHIFPSIHIFFPVMMPKPPPQYIALFIMPKPQLVMSVLFPHVMSFPLFVTVALML